MENGRPLEIRVWGDFACFTRPEMKVERVSYDIITPSAARGILEAVFWKPEFAWQILEIHVLKPIEHFSIQRNEVKTIFSERSARHWEKTGDHFYADKDRDQRHTRGLRNVAYLIRAKMVLQPHADDNIAKYRDQFRRRVQRGQAHHHPYFGCREFSAFFGPANPNEMPIDLTEDFGRMLFDLQYMECENGSVSYRSHTSTGVQIVKANVVPIFFHARLVKGIMRIPIDFDGIGG